LLAKLAANELCTFPKSKFETHQHSYTAVIAEILKNHPKIQVIDSAIGMFDGQYCYVKKGDKLLYTDFDRLSLRGSTLVAKRIVEFLISSP
jgi:hypothetical protein